MTDADRWAGRLAIPLEGNLVSLEPLEAGHADALWAVAQALEIWQWLAHVGACRESFDRWLALALQAHAEGREGVFVTRDRRDGELVGSTRYLAVRPADRVVEIGWTWLHPSAWRSGINVEQKLLLMEHAFERLGCVRVELKTDARNERSRAAMAAIPARFEGILRNHMIVPDVGQRDSAYFSVIDSRVAGGPRQPRTAPRPLAAPRRSRVAHSLGIDALFGADQLERQQHRGDREDRGEDDVRRRLRQPGGEEGVAEDAVDEVADELAEEVADELDRGEDEEDQPEVVADQGGAATQGAAPPVRPSISTTGPARPNQTKTRMPGTKKATRPTMTRAT